MTRTDNVIHPGEILMEEFIKPNDLSQIQLSEAIHVPAARINTIIKGNRSITADTALRLGIYFGTGPEFWLNLQNKYDMGIVQKEKSKDLQKIVPLKD